MLIKHDVPIEYSPTVYTCSKTKDSKKYYWKYQLPDGQWFYNYHQQSKRWSESNARRKASDLAKGLFTEKEHKRMMKNSQMSNTSINDAVDEYTRITFLIKTGKTIEKEKRTIPKCFKKLQELSKAKYIQDIKEEHIILYKNHLISCIDPNKQRRNRDHKKISASTAQSKLVLIKKVFNWLKENKKIPSNPALEVKSIKIRRELKARTGTFTQDEINQLVGANLKRDLLAVDIKKLALMSLSTSGRLDELLKMEWTDIENGIWKIRYKPKCPTQFGMGWSPKWGKERDVPLHPAILAMLDLIPQVPSVGYIRGDKTPHPANFIFTALDLGPQNRDGQRRVDKISNSWKSLLKASNLWKESADNFVFHDLRRTWNVMAKHQSGFSDALRSQLLGHSEAVNNLHYEGSVEDNVLKFQANQHPSNNMELVDLCCYFVAKTNSTKKKGSC